MKRLEDEISLYQGKEECEMEENIKNGIINGLKDNVVNNAVKVPTEIAVQIADFLKTKSQDDYKRLEASLQAYGYTVEQFFAHYDNESYVRSYRETPALDAIINIIVNSEEFSDAEKCDRLNEVHEQEKEQQKRAVSDSNKETVIKCVCIGATVVVCFGVVSLVATRKTQPIVAAASATAAGAKKIFSLPFKK